MDDIDLHYKVFMLMCIYIQYIDMHIVHPIVICTLSYRWQRILVLLSQLWSKPQRLIHDRYSSETWRNSTTLIVFFSLVPGYVLIFLWFPDIRISLGIPSGSFQHQVSILSLGRIHIVVRQNILMFCNIPAFQLSFQVSSVYLFVIYNPNIPY